MSYNNFKKLAIFDFDGTIVDSVNDVIECFNETLFKYNFPTLTREEFIGSLGGDIDDIVSLVLKDKNTPENVKLIKDSYLNTYYSSPKELTIPFAKSVETLKTLQDKGILIAINSNRFTDSVEYFIKKFFSDIDFLDIKGHDFDYPSKPHPKAVFDIIKKADVGLDEVVYIGDSNTDIQTSINAGIDCVIVRWGYGSKKDWENDYVLEAIDDFDEIFKYFK